MSAAYLGVGGHRKSRPPYFVQPPCTKAGVLGEAVEAQMAVIQTWSRAMWHTAVIRRFNLSSLKLKWVTHIILLFSYSSTHLVCLRMRMKTGSKPETDIPTSGDSGSSSLPLCTEPIVNSGVVYNAYQFEPDWDPEDISEEDRAEPVQARLLMVCLVVVVSYF